MKNLKLKIKNLRLILIFSLVLVTGYWLLATPLDVLAANNSSAAGSGGDLNAWLSSFYTWAIGLGGALAVFMIAFAAIDYASSGGDVEKMNGAKEKIVGAVVGLLLLVLTYLIVDALHTEAPTKGGTQPQINQSTGTESGTVAPSTGNPNPQTILGPPAPSA